MINFLRNVFYKLCPWAMCKCQAPSYEVKKGILCCNICDKPINRKNVEGV